MSDVKEIKKMAEIAKEKAEISKKLASAERDLRDKEKRLAKDITSAKNRSDVKYAAKKVESLSKDLSRLTFGAHQG